MKYLLLRVCGADSEDWLGVVRLDQAVCEELARRRTLYCLLHAGPDNNDLYDMRYWDAWVDYYRPYDASRDDVDASRDDVDAEQGTTFFDSVLWEKMQDMPYCLAEAPLAWRLVLASSEMCRCAVDDSFAEFSCEEKHTGVRYSRAVPWDVLVPVMQELRCAHSEET